MNNTGTTTKTTTTPFTQHITRYQTKSCGHFPLRGVCNKAKGNRTIEINYNLNRLKQKADKLLLSEEGIKHRKQRPCEVEAVFGNIKSNHHFKRFILRGIKKVNIETGLLALAHDLRKKAKQNMEQAA